MFSNDKANHELADCLIVSQTEGCSEDEFRSVITEILTILYNRIEFFDFFKGLEQKAKDKFVEKVKFGGGLWGTSVIYSFFEFYNIYPAAFIVVRFKISIDPMFLLFGTPKEADVVEIFENKNYFVFFEGAMGDIGKSYNVENFVWNPSIVIEDAVDLCIKWMIR